MPKPRSSDAKLERLRLIRDQPSSPEIRLELAGALNDASNHVIAAAAAIVVRLDLRDLIPNLTAAFERLMIDPIENDKTCAGKLAIVDALNALECQDHDVFLAGVRHVQLEPVWGGRKDTADSLRAGCAIGLVRIGYSGMLPLLVDLLTDSERIVRSAAAQSLAALGSTAALLLLRLKARLGDADPEITGECLAGLMRVEPRESAAFVAEFLHSEDTAVAELALLAFGNSRWPGAYDVLKSFWDGRPRGELKETTLVAIALLRSPAAIDWLLSLVQNAAESTAMLALSALAILNYDARVAERAADVVQSRDLADLNEMFAKKFTR
jgi:HEAT repeat protein